jgi:SAM-dependent methyltransferase
MTPMSRPEIGAPEDVELWDEQQALAWQHYHLSGMPDLLSAANLCHALLALANSGLLERLREPGPLTQDRLLDGLDERVASGFLRYLTVRGVLEHWQGGFRLTRRGELLTGDVSLARLGFYLEAYGPVTRRATDLLTGTATYGVDVARADGPLGRHSGTVSTTSYTPIVLEAMRGRAGGSLLDLGCGGGSLLVELCLRHPDLNGVGIDIAPDAIAIARRRAREEGVDDRAEFAVADAFDPGTWPGGCSGVALVCGVGVLHERFRDGDQAVIDILDTYASVLSPQGALLVGEPELRYDDRENDSDFFLVHVLTAQGVPRDRASWLELFERTRLRCDRVLRHGGAGPRTCFYELTAR